MRRLYLQIYLAFVGILLLFGLLAALAWALLPDTAEERQMFLGMEALVSDQLPAAERPDAEMQLALERIAGLFSADLSVYGRGRHLIAAVGQRLPPPAPERAESGWMRSRGRGPTVAIRMSGNRWLVARHVRDHGGHYDGLAILGLLALAIAVGSYPLARRITRRLERLQSRVDALGAGDLSARVEVEGSDEVAELAHRFNRAAERIEGLVDAQRQMLAGASHELRSPLARMRVAVELLEAGERPQLKERVARDIAELDELIEELLLASRLDVMERLERIEEVDLLGLVAEECARTGAEVGGESVSLWGDPRMLRRLVRNLLENARRYGGEKPVEAEAEQHGASALIRVADRGPGIPAAERDRIFEPFYRLSGSGESEEGGVGLGLALVKRIAQHHGGDARCLPRDGGGTLFEVELRSQNPPD